MQPLVSIITPSFNRADIISETAASIFAQTYPNWEWVIVDDGSTDESWKQLEKFAHSDSRVKIYKREREPKGACTCRNIAVQKSNGEYLIFLDTDDLLASFCLEQRIYAMQEASDNDFIIFPMLLFRKKPDDVKLLWNIETGEDDLQRILCGDPICQGTGTLWKKQSFVNAGMWDEKLLMWQDIELHIRSILKEVKYKKRMDLKPDVFIRLSEISLSRTGHHALPKFLSRLSVLKETVAALKRKKMIEKYALGLKSIYCELLINAAQSKHIAYLKEMLVYTDMWNLFSSKEKKMMKRYLLVRKFKLYKISGVEQYILQQLHSIRNPAKTRLNKIFYNHTIKI